MTELDDALEGVQERFRVEKRVARNDDVTIFLGEPNDDIRVILDCYLPVRGSNPEGYDYSRATPVRVGSAVFLGIVHDPIVDDPNDHGYARREAQRLIGQAARLVDPRIAGFPEWRHIYADDPFFLHDGVVAGLSWMTFQVTSYRRWMRQASQKERQPHAFSAKQRRVLLDRVGGQCQRCGATEALELDHIVPIAHGGTNDDDNALVLCKTCHLEKTRAERKLIGLSGRGAWARPEHRIDRMISSPSRFLAELKREAGFAIAVENSGNGIREPDLSSP